MDHDEPDQSYHAPPESKPRVRLISHEERLAILAAFGIHPGTPPTVQTHYVALAFLFGMKRSTRGRDPKAAVGIRFLRSEVARVTGGTKNGDYGETCFGLPRRSKY